MLQRERDARSGLAGGAATDRVHDDHERPRRLDGRIDVRRCAQLFDAQARELRAHRCYDDSGYAMESLWRTVGWRKRSRWRSEAPPSAGERPYRRWNGTLVTTTLGRKRRAPLMSSARWLCSR